MARITSRCDVNTYIKSHVQNIPKGLKCEYLCPYVTDTKIKINNFQVLHIQMTRPRTTYQTHSRHLRTRHIPTGEGHASVVTIYSTYKVSQMQTASNSTYTLLYLYPYPGTRCRNKLWGKLECQEYSTPAAHYIRRFIVTARLFAVVA
jgi:hypothetical protein